MKNENASTEKTKQGIILLMGEYFDLLQLSGDNSIGYLGELIAEELKHAEDIKDFQRVYTFLSEYAHLIKKTTEGQQGFLLDSLLETLEPLTDKGSIA